MSLLKRPWSNPRALRIDASCSTGEGSPESITAGGADPGTKDLPDEGLSDPEVAAFRGEREWSILDLAITAKNNDSPRSTAMLMLMFGTIVRCVAGSLLLVGLPVAQFPAQLVRQAGRIELPASYLPVGTSLCEFASYIECCGFESGGHEYAAVGCSHGVWIVMATGGSPVDQHFATRAQASLNPDPIDFPTVWRDVAFYQTQTNKFVLSVVGFSPTHAGLHVLDVTNISPTTDPINRVIMHGLWTSAHTLHVDQERSLLFINGAFGTPSGTSLYIFDISAFDGVNAPPAIFPPSGQPYVGSHDSFSRFPRAYIAMPDDGTGSNRFDVLDLSVSPPALMPAASWPAVGFPAHNVWTSEDQKLIAATEEGTPGVLRLLQVATPPLIGMPPSQPAGGFYQETNGGTLPEGPHNAYGIGATIYLSHYTAGFQLVDATDPNAPIRRAYYDTFPYTPDSDKPSQAPPDVVHGQNCGPHSGSLRSGYFRGAYDCYPYQDSGFVYVTDSEKGLFVLEILAGHFFRTQAATQTPGGAVPNIYPSGATPRSNATQFQFRITGLVPAGRYEFRLTRDAVDDPPVPIGWYVGNTVVLTADEMSWPVPATGEVKIPWNSNYPSLTDLYAQVIQKDAQGVPVGSSKLIRFALLP